MLFISMIFYQVHICIHIYLHFPFEKLWDSILSEEKKEHIHSTHTPTHTEAKPSAAVLAWSCLPSGPVLGHRCPTQAL